MKNWEIKDRTYVLTGRNRPLTYVIKSKNILWFDEDKGARREIRYCVNENSPFLDEQGDHARLGHIMFTDGAIHVPKANQALQKILSVFHPKMNKWEEIDDVKEATDDVEIIELQLEASKVVQEIELEHLEAIMRTELGSSVTSMSSKELKRDAYLFARQNPELFLELSKDEDLKLRNLANRAVEAGILKLTDENTVFKLVSTGKKILTVPFDQHPFAALSSYFKTDDGVNLLKSIIKKLS